MQNQIIIENTEQSVHNLFSKPFVNKSRIMTRFDRYINYYQTIEQMSFVMTRLRHCSTHNDRCDYKKHRGLIYRDDRTSLWQWVSSLASPKGMIQSSEIGGGYKTMLPHVNLNITNEISSYVTLTFNPNNISSWIWKMYRFGIKKKL